MFLIGDDVFKRDCCVFVGALRPLNVKQRCHSGKQCVYEEERCLTFIILKVIVSQIKASLKSQRCPF